MPTLYRDTGYSLIHLIEDIKRRRLALPDIQRPFVWSSAKARDLFDSMYRGYPIGTLMFWETGAEVGTRQIGAAESDKVRRSCSIVDGQQRLTSLFAVLTGHQVLTKTFEHKRIRIAFRPERRDVRGHRRGDREGPRVHPGHHQPVGRGLQDHRPQLPAAPRRRRGMSRSPTRSRIFSRSGSTESAICATSASRSSN